MISIHKNEIKLPIRNDSGLAVSIIKLLIERVLDMGITEAVGMGLDPKLFERLCQLKVNDYSHLNRFDSKMFAILNTDGLHQFIASVDAEEKFTNYISYFIRRGANATILKKILHISDEQIKHFKEFWGTDMRRGRPSKPDIAVQDEIVSAWHTINAVNSTLSKCEKWFELSERFPDVRIDSLFAVVNDTNK